MSELITPQALAEIRRHDEIDLKAAEKTDGALDETAWERHVLLAEVDRLRAELKIAFGPGLYLDIQQVLDKALGTDEADGAGAGIVADISLVVERMQAAEAEVDRRDRIMNSAFDDLVSDRAHVAEQTLREALFVPAVEATADGEVDR